jgi:hypothetical protein
MATVSTTFTFSSTDITSDALSFTVSETLSLTGSGGIRRFNLSDATNSGSAYQVYNSQSFNETDPTYLFIKNITGSGYSGSAGAAGTSSYVHVFMSGSGPAANGKWATLQGAHDGLPSLATIPQGGFTYLPINPNASYYIYSADHTGSEGNITASTIVEFGVFN